MIEKVESADIVIWLDDVQFTKGGWTNRNRMPDGAWLTIPLLHPRMVPIRQVRIDKQSDWQRRHCRTIRQHYGEVVKPFCVAIMEDYDYLVTLNLHLLSLLLMESTTRPYLQSEVTVKSGETISDQLAAMVYALDGDVYLSGSSGRSYLDEGPFHERGLEVRYTEPRETNPCVLSRYLDVTV